MGCVIPKVVQLLTMASRRTGIALCLSLLCLESVAAEMRDGGLCRDPITLPQQAPPTEQQLALGRELLDKIAYVIGSVPFEDPVAVLGVFGFAEVSSTVRQTYTEFQPKGAQSGGAMPKDLLGTGLTHIRSDPLIVPDEGYEYATFSGFNGRFNLDEACVLIDDVRRKFGNAKNITVYPSIVAPGAAGYGSRRQPLNRRDHDIGAISFDPVPTASGLLGGVSFAFDYQNCAMGFGAGYLVKYKGMSK